jgi:hypothetical protein
MCLAVVTDRQSQQQHMEVAMTQYDDEINLDLHMEFPYLLGHDKQKNVWCRSAQCFDHVSLVSSCIRAFEPIPSRIDC